MNKSQYAITPILSFLFILASNQFTYATRNADLKPITGTGNLNPLLTGPYAKTSVRTTFNNFVSGIIGLLTLFAALYFLIQIIFAGYTILNSQGDSAKLNDGRERITFGVLGLAVVVSAYLLIALISGLLGITFIFNPLGNTTLFQ